MTTKLSHAGLINASRGKGGGLTRSNDQITLKMVFKAFYEDPTNDIILSNKASDKLNILYLSFLDELPVYKNSEIIESFGVTKETEQKTEKTVDDFDLSDGWD